MKESYWGYWLIALGVFVVVIMLLIQNVTSNSTEDYYTLKQISEAAMIDAVDYAYYREYGEVKINKEKYMESFLRRFVENASLSTQYTIAFSGIYEAPPKASVEVTSKTNTYFIASSNESFDISDRVDAILEQNGEPAKVNTGESTTEPDKDTAGTPNPNYVPTPSTPTTPTNPSTPTTPTTPTNPTNPTDPSTPTTPTTPTEPETPTNPDTTSDPYTIPAGCDVQAKLASKLGAQWEYFYSKTGIVGIQCFAYGNYFAKTYYGEQADTGSYWEPPQLYGSPHWIKHWSTRSYNSSSGISKYAENKADGDALLANVQPGDVIRYHYPSCCHDWMHSVYGGHTAVVWKVEGSTVYLFEDNYNWTNHIDYTRTAEKAEIANDKFAYIIRYENPNDTRTFYDRVCSQ